MAPFTNSFIIQPISSHTHTLILLHDRGSSGADFALDILNAVTSSGRTLQTLFPGTKFVFPNANHQCVTVLGGPRMPQWFDNFSTRDPCQREALQFKGLRESAHYIHRLVDDEASIPLENTFLGGFSQGSAMALYALLAYRPYGRSGSLGGFVGMSGWLPLRKSLDGLISFYADETHAVEEGFDMDTQMSTLLRNQIGLPPTTEPPQKYSQIAFAMFHGEADEEVPTELANQAVDALSKLGLDVTLKSYANLSHQWKNDHELDDVTGFLVSRGVT